MRIRKAFQGTIPPNKILDTYSTSKTDTYSCNYVNNRPIAQLIYQNTTKQGAKWSYVSPVASGGFASGPGITCDIANSCIRVTQGSYVRISLDISFTTASYNYENDIMIYCNGGWHGFKQTSNSCDYHIANVILPINTTDGQEVTIYVGKYTGADTNQIITKDNALNHFTVEVIG